MDKESATTLVPLEQYLKVGIHIGTKFRTKYMSEFIYKVRPDGLAVLNVQEIDKRLGLAANFMAQFDPKDIVIVCRRENGWDAVKLFAELIGCRVFVGRYPPGILTNPDLDNFIEAKLMLVVDPWPDKNAVRDASKQGIPVIGMCDTNNETNYLDFVVPCNNKGKKSLGLVLWILAKEFLKKQGKIKDDKEVEEQLEVFTAD
ncbi:30S ribosomal protein S2 [archaeon]|mgnify:CR=1 FL=1|nr:30S ribosomal protein S2 [archaeon]|tara:strand:+ start:2422 stop:3027 length:606 start_codon:yes stop_codon:yes gene_type:complete